MLDGWLARYRFHGRIRVPQVHLGLSMIRVLLCIISVMRSLDDYRSRVRIRSRRRRLGWPRSRLFRRDRRFGFRGR